MANWLTKFMAPAKIDNRQGQLPVTVKPRPSPAPLISQTPQAKLPNASIIYGGAASALFVVAFYFLLKGLWFTGFLILLLAVCFLGFALHFLKHSGQ